MTRQPTDAPDVRGHSANADLQSGPLRRRAVLKALAGVGVGTVVFHRAVAAQMENVSVVTPEMIRQAEWIAGLELDEDQRRRTANAVDRALENFERMRAVALQNGIPPALVFQVAATAPSAQPVARGTASPREWTTLPRPGRSEDLAFLPVTELAGLVRSRQVSSRELTELYLSRLRQYDPALLCVVEETEELALRQADRADSEIAAGRYRGPLHGIPWGAKDLIAVPGYPTTWGATPYREQQLPERATVAERLEQAGAVLVAKLSLGALAAGDRWFGGQTRNPWNNAEGSSGSSAGSAAATSAALVGFAIGSETHGSIVSPCRRCGTTGLRPTFGRVSRHGCMTLSWSMDKLGPIARSVEDCALILDAIHGADGLDFAAVDRPFHWPDPQPLSSLRVGYVATDQDAEREELRVLEDLGVQLVPIELPDRYPISPLLLILYAEAATAFDELTRSGVTEGLNYWPEAFRNAQFTPAVEYLRANRIRTLLMREMQDVMAQVDAYVGGDDLTLTNLTGHPTVVLPFGMIEREGARVPGSITFTGPLFGETRLLALAHAFQQATGDHLRRPDLSQLEPVDADAP